MEGVAVNVGVGSGGVEALVHVGVGAADREVEHADVALAAATLDPVGDCGDGVARRAPRRLRGGARGQAARLPRQRDETALRTHTRTQTRAHTNML